MHQNLCEGSQLSFWQLNLFTFTDSVGYILVSLFIQEGFFLFWKHTLSWKHTRLRFPFFFCFWYESSCERRCQFFFFFFIKCFFHNKNPSAVWFPRRTASQPSIQQDENGKKKERKKKRERKHEHLGKLWRLLISSLLHIPPKTSHKLSGYWLTF